MTKELVSLMNKQINAELYSAYIYFSFATYLKQHGFNGFAKWYKIQAYEETEHAWKFLDYLCDNGQDVVLTDIKTSNMVINSLHDIFEGGLAHEKHVTDLIKKIYAKAEADSDCKAKDFLMWFIKEQEEEEENATKLLEDFVKYKDDTRVLSKLDKEAGKRK